jgi:solute carrier family 35 protein F5
MTIKANGFSSFLSDICWAYAMLLTSPLIVTVGLSLNIPLALFGQMILQDQYSTAIYWVGGVIVLMSFVLINYETSSEKLPEKTLPENSHDASSVH